MTNWNLDLALTNFFESNEDSDTEVVAHPRDPTPPRGTDHSARHGVPAMSGSAAQGGGKGAAKPAGPSSKIASLSTLRKDEKSDESSEEEEGQAYYAGGSERTGQQILGPPKKKTNPDKLISGLFTAAKEHGAEEMEPEGGAASAGGGPRVVPFQGRAYRLGDPSTQSEVIEGTQVQQKRKVDVAMKFWRNGFSLNDGPLREFDTPQNVEFVNAIRRNEVPRELIEQARGGEVNLSLEDHRNEDYVAPKKLVQSFTGVGHRLGSPTDAGINMDTGAASSSSAAAAYIACSTSTAAAAATGAASSSSLSSTASAAEADAARSIQLDASQPLTNLQIRLSDGSRLVAKFNHSHTVSDVRRYIVSARPQFANTNFVLMTTFPNRELSDEKQTLAAANLLNAVLVQKSK
jgi:UBX domain-containing protein 1